MSILSFMPDRPESLVQQVERLRTLHREIKNLELESTKLKSHIIAQMGDTDQVINHQGHVIATYKQNSKMTFNQHAFESAYPDQYKTYLVEKTYRTFLLK